MKYDLDVKSSEALHEQNMKKAETKVVALTPQQKSLHNNFRESARALKKSLVRTIYYLGAIKHQKIHKMMGYRTIDDYAFDVAGLTPKQTRNFLSLAPKLPAFQEVERAVDQGSISMAKAQEICNHINPQDQEHWITQAESTSLKDLKRRLRTPRDQPTLPRVKQPSEPGVEYHHLSLKLTGEQLARWHSCLEYLMKGKAKPKEDLILESLASGGTKEPAGQPPYLIVLLECPSCRRASMPTNRGELPVSPAMLRAGHCDATVEDPSGQRRAVIPPRVRRLALRSARYTCQQPGCRTTSFLEIHHRTPLAQGGTNDLANLIVLCWRCHRRLHEAEERALQLKNLAP